MSVKWTPERRAKFKATMKRKREGKKEDHKEHKEHKARGPYRRAAPQERHHHSPEALHHQDAIIYLRHAEREIMKETSGGKKLNTTQLYTLLALKALQGES